MIPYDVNRKHGIYWVYIYGRNDVYTHLSTKKTFPLAISSYLYCNKDELHDNHQQHAGGVAHCEYGMSGCDSLIFFANVSITK